MALRQHTSSLHLLQQLSRLGLQFTRPATIRHLTTSSITSSPSSQPLPPSAKRSSTSRRPSSRKGAPATSAPAATTTPPPVSIPHPSPVEDASSSAKPASGPTPRTLTARVLKAGLAQKTITVQVIRQSWNPFLRKNIRVRQKHLVHDEEGKCREGDVVRIWNYHPRVTATAAATETAETKAGAVKKSKHVDTKGTENRAQKLGRKRFVVKEVLVPFGTPLEKR
jgi:small subunit ribosomal protein S17